MPNNSQTESSVKQNSQPKQFSKDYGEYMISPQGLRLDPYLYTTDTVNEQIQNFRQMRMIGSAFNTALAIILTAPMQTIVAALQLSVKPHLHIYDKQAIREKNDLDASSKQIKKLNTQLTIQEKRRMQLLIRSTQKQPYTAPIYTSYGETIRALSRQGWKAFFKGLGFRLAHTMGHIYPMIFMKDLINIDDLKAKPIMPFLYFGQIYLTKVGIDICCNFLHVGENRYILQNNIKQFKIYQGVWKFIKRVSTRGDMWKGISFHFSNNLIDMFFRLPFYLGLSESLTQEKSRINFLKFVGIPFYFGQILTYPISTAFRRITCQCTETAGMIPLRYKSISHALKVIAFQEGIKGLYRGFSLYHMVIAARIGILVGVTLEMTSQKDF